MDDFDIRDRLRPTLHRNETVRWTGSSSTFAFLPSQFPIVAASSLLALTFGWPALRGMWRGAIVEVTPVQYAMLLIGAVIAAWTVRSILRDVAVAWAVTDRNIHRISRAGISSVNPRGSVSIEMRPRDGGRGDVVITMPQVHVGEGRTTQASIVMLDIEDLDDASAAISILTKARENGPINMK